MNSSIRQDIPVFPASQSVSINPGTGHDGGLTATALVARPEIGERVVNEAPLSIVLRAILEENEALMHKLKATIADEMRSIALNISFKDRKKFDCEEVARIIHLSECTVRRYLKEGRIRGNKRGSKQQARWEVLRTDLEDYLKQKNMNTVG